MGAPLLLLGALWVQSVCAGSHSLMYFYSALSRPLPGLPLFFRTGFVDDAEFSWYPGEGGRAEPRAPWMERISAERPQYWDWITHRCRGHERVFRADLSTVMRRVNQTRGLHIVQVIIGCELRADGSIGGIRQDAYDGRDLISFDKDRMTFVAASDPARVTQDQWNSERSIAQFWKGYLEGECIEYLRKHLKNGAERLQRRVRPELRVSRTMTGVDTTLTCYAYGFYPREIDVKWVRNGVEMPWKSKQILPHPDGTYQLKTTMEIYEGDDVRNYTCQVDHSSLEETVTVVYAPPAAKSSSTVDKGVLAVVIFGVVLLLPAVGGFIFWKKKCSAKEGYSAAKPGPEAEGSSSSSSGLSTNSSSA